MSLPNSIKTDPNDVCRLVRISDFWIAQTGAFPHNPAVDSFLTLMARSASFESFSLRSLITVNKLLRSIAALIVDSI